MDAIIVWDRQSLAEAFFDRREELMKSVNIVLGDEENVLFRKVFEIFALHEKVRIHHGAVVADALRRRAFLRPLDFDVDFLFVVVESMDVELYAAAMQVFEFVFCDDAGDGEVIAARHEHCKQLPELEIALEDAAHEGVVHETELSDELEIFRTPSGAFFFGHVWWHGKHLLPEYGKDLLGSYFKAKRAYAQDGSYRIINERKHYNCSMVKIFS